MLFRSVPSPPGRSPTPRPGRARRHRRYAGKGLPEQENHDALPLMLEELSDWFEDYVGGQYGGITCAAIVPDGKPNPVVCGGLVAACFEQILRILMEHGFDPSQEPA